MHAQIVDDDDDQSTSFLSVGFFFLRRSVSRHMMARCVRGLRKAVSERSAAFEQPPKLQVSKRKSK
jgi:hypothetical protein